MTPFTHSTQQLLHYEQVLGPTDVADVFKSLCKRQIEVRVTSATTFYADP